MNSLQELHVLIVEDNSTQRGDLAGALRAEGVKYITEARDGRAGLAALEKVFGAYDLVLCDLEMEGMDGLEFIRHSANHGVSGLILCSALDDAVLSSAEWMARAYNAPLLGVLSKPLDAAALRKLIAKCDGNYTVFSDIMPGDTSADAPDRRAIGELREALEAHQFIPFYQPKVSIATGELVGAEILARWQHPDLGILAPSRFVDLMETSDLIDPLTHQILAHACQDAARWANDGLHLPLSINVSPITLQRTSSARQLLATIAATPMPPRTFTIEITEKAFAHDVQALLENILRLRMHGCGISVDDFGTGYSSLQQLHRIAVTELKLDRSFVRRIPGQAKALSIVESMIDLSRKLNLTTVAEGIDNEEQRVCLAGLGCDIGQGYLFARPMPEAELIRWCARREHLPA